MKQIKGVVVATLNTTDGCIPFTKENLDELQDNDIFILSEEEPVGFVTNTKVIDDTLVGDIFIKDGCIGYIVPNFRISDIEFENEKKTYKNIGIINYSLVPLPQDKGLTYVSSTEGI